MKPNGSQKTKITAKAKPKVHRPRIEIIERKPQPDWFVRARNEHGKLEWFLRIQCTGLYPRRFGPFPTKQRALLFLDDVLNETLDTITGTSSQWEPNRACILEDALGTQYLAARNANPRLLRQASSQKGR